MFTSWSHQYAADSGTLHLAFLSCICLKMTPFLRYCVFESPCLLCSDQFIFDVKRVISYLFQISTKIWIQFFLSNRYKLTIKFVRNDKKYPWLLLLESFHIFTIFKNIRPLTDDEAKVPIEKLENCLPTRGLFCSSVPIDMCWFSTLPYLIVERSEK